MLPKSHDCGERYEEVDLSSDRPGGRNGVDFAQRERNSGASIVGHSEIDLDPNKVDTTAGMLEFFDGVPIGTTVKTVYDNLDRARGLGVYLDNVGAVSIYSVLAGLAEQGADAPNKIALFGQLMDSQTLVATANTSTLYAYSGTDLANDGPTVIEVPPGMLGFLDDAWQRFVGEKCLADRRSIVIGCCHR